MIVVCVLIILTQLEFAMIVVCVLIILTQLEFAMIVVCVFVTGPVFLPLGSTN